MQKNSKLGIVVNPMSGRDVRRVAARASTSGHHEKSQQVTRLVLAAVAQGVEEIFLANEPFRINERAVENLPERDRVTIFSFPLKHTAEDTRTMVQMMWDQGCRVFIVLGGDGTNRIVARSFPDATILPLSTGTNNVFPVFVEASVAGAAAGLIATQKLDATEHCLRCKQVHVVADGYDNDLALIDAVLLRNDFIGSLLPFAAENIASVLLTRSEPASVGVSPIGGYIEPSEHHDDFGVFVDCEKGTASHHINVPISPGLYNDVHVRSIARQALDEEVIVSGPGILAFDGDRTIQLATGDQASLTVARDGPRIIEPSRIMKTAALAGLMRR